jgi:hypothetical protein
MNRLENLFQQLVNLFLGFYKITFGITSGNTLITGAGTPVTGDWCAFQILSSTGTISSITMDNTTSTALSAIPLNQGIMVYGKITSITPAVGTVVKCYGSLSVMN